MDRRHCFLLLLLPMISFADTAANDPCASLLSLVNRPTTADSVCAVKPGHVMVEMGFQYRDLYPGEGHENVYPQEQLRFGLPVGNEFTVLPPQYIEQYGVEDPQNGFTATVAGLKHQFPTIGKFTYAGEGLLTFPSGGDEAGSDGAGFALNGILSYSATDTLSFAMMLGVTTATTSTHAGGDRYNSFNPDVVITWQFTEIFQYYAEFYGQTKTGPDQSDGYNADTGFQYLPTENIELDIEYGQRLSGQLEGFARYIGAGGGIRF